MKPFATSKNGRKAIILAAGAASWAAGHFAHAGTTGAAVTISLSGSTAIRSFTTSAGFTFVNPDSVLNIGGTNYPANVNQWTGSGGTLQSFQLAPANSNGAVSTGNNQAANALRVEWHEQGSVEGILELANDQVAPIGSVTVTNRNPTLGNPVWVNRLSFDASAGKAAGDTQAGFLLGPVNTVGGGATGVAQFTLGGLSTTNGQNAVQMAISDVTGRQGFSAAGASAYNRTPGQAGYGKGNTALAGGANAQALGEGNVRHELADASVLNMPAAAINPRTGAAFGAGAWNAAGVDNLDNKTIGITATVFAANPGTGLEKLNRADAQFLQTAGRLPNGADFNVVTRDVNSGTLNVAALNVGLDPSFAVGENDNGNGNAADGAGAQVAIGSGLKFSNKTAGGAQLRPTIQNARMAVGHLSMSDAIGSAVASGQARPLRALSYRDDDNDIADNSNNAYRPAVATGDQRDAYADPTSNAFVQPSAASIVNGSYVIYQNETYVTVKKPGAAFAGDSAAQWAARTDIATGIQGDTANGDVFNLRKNVLESVATFPHASVSSPADSLLDNSLLLPQLMSVKKGGDGINQSVANASVDSSLQSLFLNSQSYTIKFNPDPAASVTKGTSGKYGNVTPAGTGAINVTDQNYLFGNFAQNGVRDFAAIKIALDAQAKLVASGAGVDMFGGSANSTVVAGVAAPLAAMTNQAGGAGATKGDLIVLGDFNGDGKFDGKDLAMMARGAALSDSTATDKINLAGGETFGSALRRAVLVKNAALDYVQANATAQQKVDATASVANDPAGAHAFDKFDVNRDGKVNIYDGKIVARIANRNGANGSSISSLQDQLSVEAAVVGSTNGLTGPLGNRMLSLVDAELNDDGKITGRNGPGIAVLAGSDYALIQTRVRGDFNFDSSIDAADINPFVVAALDPAAFVLGKPDLLSTDLPIIGDFNNDGSFDAGDINGFVARLLASGADVPADFTATFAAAAVPEPGSLSLLGVAAAGLLKRRRRSGR